MSYRLHPPFAACMRWAFTYFLGAVIAMLLFTAAARAIQGRPLPQHWSDEPVSLSMLLFGIVLGAGVLIFCFSYIVGAVATPSHLRASTYWGRRVQVPWSSIERISAESMHGLPALVIRTSASRAALYVYVMGLDRKEAYTALCAIAGANNELTRCFAAGKS